MNICHILDISILSLVRAKLTLLFEDRKVVNGQVLINIPIALVQVVTDITI